MDWGTAAQWAGTATAIGLGVWAAFSKKSDKALEGVERDVHGAQSDLRRLFERVDGVEVRLGKIEVEVEHLPTKDEFHQLHTEITKLDAKFDSVLYKLDTLVSQYERAEARAIQAEAAAR
ncbi:DUF2730 family protein [Methylosinus sp. H3A]|uniref:DUF2730 family protein n=1 Tax=Methylosinus sp. H3A TaxID=2785786 RepID=UPI001AED8168|nr:DUF2730 family protein [Methylosinus sp. H3A]